MAKKLPFRSRYTPSDDLTPEAAAYWVRVCNYMGRESRRLDLRLLRLHSQRAAKLSRDERLAAQIWSALKESDGAPTHPTWSAAKILLMDYLIEVQTRAARTGLTLARYWRKLK